MKTHAIRLGFCLAAALIAGCGDKPAPAPGSEPAGEPPLLRVGHVGHDHQLALYVAALEGEALARPGGVWLREKKSREVYDLMRGREALARLHLVKVGGGSRMPAAMERGEIDVGYGGVAAVAFFRDKGLAVRILSPLQTEGDMLVVRPDAPAEDWEGFVAWVKASPRPVRVGYKAPVAVAKLIFVRALREASIPFRSQEEEAGDGPAGGSVELVNLQGGGNMVPSLVSGAVDAFVMNQPQVSLAKVRKAGRVVAELADLPPEGLWKDHPCCCIAATEETIRGRRPALEALMTLTLAATAYIRSDPGRAAEKAAAWTKLPVEVERDSVPSIVYLAEFTPSWKKGMHTWADIMNEIGKFQGELKGRKGDAFLDLLCDTSLMDDAARRWKEENE